LTTARAGSGDSLGKSNDNYILRISVAALLVAVGFVIPMYSPFKIILEPAASFTLGSHVAIFIAMFISPLTAVTVALGTAAGFFFAGVFPPFVVLRAASHVVFATAGAFYLKKAKNPMDSALRLRIFSFLIALIHASCEVAVVSVFYFGGSMSAAVYQKSFLTYVVLLVGLGTVIHSMVDFEIALLIKAALEKSGRFGKAILNNR
jgi:niacin transporter